MNSLRKTFLALSLIAIVPNTVQAYNWSDFKGKITGWFGEAKDYIVEQAPIKANAVSRFAKENKKTTAAGVLGAAVVLGGAGYFAKRYGVVSKARKGAGKVISAPKNFTKSVYNRFSALSRTKKAGVVIGGAVVAVGAAYLAKSLWNKYNAPAASNP